MQLPDSAAQLILDTAGQAMTKASGVVAKQRAFHDSIKAQLDDLAFAKGLDSVQAYAAAIDSSPTLQSGIYQTENALKEAMRQSVARGGDGRS